MTKTAWTIVAIDETYYWHDAIVEKAGRLYGIYLYDANRHTYCCELTPSYELHFIESVTTKHIDEATYDMVMEGDRQNDSVVYYHCSTIDKVAAALKEALTKHDDEYEEVDDTGKVWDGLLDDMLEMLRGNQHVPAGVKFEDE